MVLLAKWVCYTILYVQTGPDVNVSGWRIKQIEEELLDFILL